MGLGVRDGGCGKGVGEEGGEGQDGGGVEGDDGVGEGGVEAARVGDGVVGDEGSLLRKYHKVRYDDSHK